MRKAAPLGATCRGPKAQDLHPRVQVPAMVVARKPPPPPPPRRTAQLETQAKAAAGQTLPESQESLLPWIAEGTPRVASICKFWVAGTCRRTPCAYTHDFRCKRKRSKRASPSAASNRAAGASSSKGLPPLHPPSQTTTAEEEAEKTEKLFIPSPRTQVDVNQQGASKRPGAFAKQNEKVKRLRTAKSPQAPPLAPTEEERLQALRHLTSLLVGVIHEAHEQRREASSAQARLLDKFDAITRNLDQILSRLEGIGGQ